jgi:hypothetical protein
MEAFATNTPKDITVAYAALLAFLNNNTYSLDALVRSRQRVRE